MLMTSEKTRAVRVIGAPKRISDAASECLRKWDPLMVEVVERGLVPPSAPHPIRTFDRASDWLFNGWKAGVYHYDGTHCELSRLDRVHTNVTEPYDADELANIETRVIPGEAVYGGMLSYHFGHFLVESTTRLWWPLLQNFAGPIVFQCVGRRGLVPDFATRFFKLIGLTDRILVTDSGGYRFDRVIVPERSFAIKRYWHPDFRVAFLHAGAAVERCWRPLRRDDNDAAGLYLSRTRYDYRRSIGERKLERDFAQNGFAIAHTETLPLEEQISLARRHTAIAGIQGSAFHNILFSKHSKKAVYICRDYEVNQNFFMIDEMMANRGTYIYSGLARDALYDRSDREVIAEQYKQDVKLDLDKIFWALAQVGLFANGS